MKLLISKGANVEARTKGGSTALYDAAEENKLEILIALLHAGADINAKNGPENWTALDIATSRMAISHNHAALVNVLTLKGAKASKGAEANSGNCTLS